MNKNKEEVGPDEFSGLFSNFLVIFFLTKVFI